MKENNLTQHNITLMEILNEDIASAVKREQNSFDDLTFPFKDRLVLFGAGGLGRMVLNGLRKAGIAPLAFADNNSSLWGKIIEGLQVLKPEDAAHKYGSNAAFIVTIWRAGGTHRFAHTQKQLYDLNCLKVVSFAFLFWKYPDIFLPYYTIGLPHILLSQKEQIINVFKLWEDAVSCHEYLAQLLWRLLLDFDCLPSPVAFTQYFPDDLYNLSNDEIFVDCGAFDGDTIKEFFKRQPNFKGKLFAIEPDPINIQKLNNYLKTVKKVLKDSVRIIPMAIGTKKEKVRFSATGSAASVVDPEGALEVDCAPLDYILGNDNPTFLKMDIEGAELDAIYSAANSIKKNLPILAISVYHQPDHLWSIPLLIHSLSDQYRLYLRPHNEEGWDLVTYAVPFVRLKK